MNDLARRLTAIVAVGLAAAGALLAGSQPGPDLARYQDWTRAVDEQTMAPIRSDTLSPVGVPSTQWSAGPGSLIAGASVLLGPRRDTSTATYVVGWFAALGFWALAALVVWQTARSDVAITILGLGTLFLATHAGFYTRAHASESFTYPAVALVAWIALRSAAPTWRESIWAGGATALLVMTRPYLAVYALPAMAAIARPDVRGVEGVSRACRRLLLTGSVIVLALAQTLVVNHWMTGSPWQSPYDFGDGAFRSLDWRRPEFDAVLLHPWHGLLPVHPFYLAGFVLVLVGSVTGEQAAERRYLALSAVAIGINLYVQASWYVWWLGTGTFGMRGLAAAAVPTIVALAHRLASARHASTRVAWAVAAAACSLWSLPFLARGNANAVTYDALWKVRDDGLHMLAENPGFLLVAAVGAAALGIALVGRVTRPRVGSLVVAGVASIVGGLALAQLFAQGWQARLPEAGPVLLGGLLLALGWALATEVIALVGPLLTGARASSEPLPDAPDAVGAHVGWAMTAAVIWALLVFAPLGIATTRSVASRDDHGVSPQAAGRRFVAPFTVGEVVASYGEYQAVEGFVARKAALRAFLERHGAPAPASR